jgi:hypothetical protein
MFIIFIYVIHYTHACMHTHTQAYTHTHTHTHTLTHTQRRKRDTEEIKEIERKEGKNGVNRHELII